MRECRFEGEPRQLLLKLDFEEGKRFSCPQCGKLCPTHDTSTKRWKHLNFFQYERLLEARVPRSDCPEHGVQSVAVPWAREGSGFALLFEALACCCAGRCRWRRSPTLWRNTTPGCTGGDYVERANNSWAQVRRVSVDETSARRGHRYVTNVLDAEAHRLLLMVEGRSAEALEAFAQALMAHGGRPNRSNSSVWTVSPAIKRSEPLFSAGRDRL